MKKIKKVSIWVVGIFALTVILLLSYVKVALPSIGEAPEMRIERTPQRIERGEYLANHVAVCMDCHSQRDWSKFSGPPIPGTLGMGGELFNQKFGFPGSYHAANITPAGIGDYTDGELFRAITTGVTNDGRALFPVMPYYYFGQMDTEDIKSIIAYIRTLKPIKNEVPASESDFPMNFIINTIPQKANLTKMPDKSDIVSYGKYMTTAAACMECHTKVDDKGKLISGMEFGGGREFPLPNGTKVRSANISSDKNTGIGDWTAETFLEIFHNRSDSAILSSTLNPKQFNTIMPWTMYGKMHDDDLKAIYAYLKTVKPVNNQVELYVPEKNNNK